eukprot:4427070-Prymnesium_polylepis.2
MVRRVDPGPHTGTVPSLAGCDALDAIRPPVARSRVKRRAALAVGAGDEGGARRARLQQQRHASKAAGAEREAERCLAAGVGRIQRRAAAHQRPHAIGVASGTRDVQWRRVSTASEGGARSGVEERHDEGRMVAEARAMQHLRSVRPG